MKILGLDRVLHNLNKEIKNIEGRSHRGLLLAAAQVRRDMDQTPPLIPVDTGHLRGSWFAEPLTIPYGIAVICGFAANYAIYVHERMGAKFKRPGAGPKFFQASFRRNKEQILTIIKNHVEIPR